MSPRNKKIIFLSACPILIGLVLISGYFGRPNSAPADVSFIDASARLNHTSWSTILDTSMSPGVCVLDANADGWQDLFIPGLGDFNTDPKMLPGHKLGNRLFINQGLDNTLLPVFEEVGDGAGIRNIGKFGVGCAVADYDNDGDEDILVTNATKGVYYSVYGSFDSSSGPRLFPPDFFITDKTDGKYNFPDEGGVTLFENLGGNPAAPRFEDVTIGAGLTRGGNGTAAAWADVDLDGWVDLYVGNYSDADFAGYSYKSFAGQFNVLYKNNNNKTFTDVSDSAGVAGEAEYVYDLAGNKQYGYSRTELDSAGHIVGDPAGNTLAVAFFDYNQDRLPDLITADDVPGRIRLYKNLGSFKFEEVSEQNEFGQAGAWMGIAIGDIDSNGELDVFAANFGGPLGSLYRQLSNRTFMMDILNPPNKATTYHGLWTNNNGQFKEISKQVAVDWGLWIPAGNSKNWNASEILAPKPEGLQSGEFGFGSVMFDYDNDSDLDFGWIGSLGRSELQTYKGNPGRLLSNSGNGLEFVDVARRLGVTNLTDKEDFYSYQNGRGMAVGDFNNDGYYDLIMTNAGGYDIDDPHVEGLKELGRLHGRLGLAKEFRPGPTFLYISSAGKNNWIKFKLIGSKSNRSAIGAKITVAYHENGAVQKQIREVRAGESFASQNSLEQIFGLGKTKKIDSAQIIWPSGEVQEFTNLRAGQRLVITEE